VDNGQNPPPTHTHTLLTSAKLPMALQYWDAAYPERSKLDVYAFSSFITPEHQFVAQSPVSAFHHSNPAAHHHALTRANMSPVTQDFKLPPADKHPMFFNSSSSSDKLDLEIVPFVDRLTGNQVYMSSFTVFSPCQGANVFTQANRKGDDIAQVASDYLPAELAYFKVLVGPHHFPFSTSNLCVMAILGRNDRHDAKFILLSFVDGGPS